MASIILLLYNIHKALEPKSEPRSKFESVAKESSVESPSGDSPSPENPSLKTRFESVVIKTPVENPQDQVQTSGV